MAHLRNLIVDFRRAAGPETKAWQVRCKERFGVLSYSALAKTHMSWDGSKSIYMKVEVPLHFAVLRWPSGPHGSLRYVSKCGVGRVLCEG